ncbi:MAG: SusC/RagA family TonB-linked outer membrane protein [Marinifilaceae bacterium]
MIKHILKLSLTLSFFLITQILWAQGIKIQGIVYDKDSGLTLPGVSVYSPKYKVGCATDINGKFEINLSGSTHLQFTFVGYKTQEIDALKSGDLKIYMKAESEQMDEVMVVAYGTAKKESFTGSAEVIGKKELERRPISNLTRAIDGTVAGVQSSSGGGQPGAGPQIIIRGIGSLNASSMPLYVVDGVPFEGSINSINPQDIESMSILKDASSSALYGSRGANGVVIITTKKGSEGKTNINFKANIGVLQRATPQHDVLNASEFMEATWDMIRFSYEGLNEKLAAEKASQEFMGRLGGEMYNPFSVHSSELIDVTTGKVVDGAVLKWNDNWLDEAMRKTPVRQEYSLSINGGNKTTQYLISGAYLDEKGVVDNSDFNRLSLRGKVDTKLKSWWKAGMAIGVSLTETNNITSSGNNADNIWFAGVTMGPIYPVYERDETGEVIVENGKKKFDYGKTRPVQKDFNTVALLFDDKLSNRNDNLNLRTYMDFSDKENMQLGFLRHFSLSVNLGVDYQLRSRHTFYNPFTGNSAHVNGSMTKENVRTMSYTTNQLLKFDRKWKGHTLNILAGHEFYELQVNNLSAGRTGFMYGDANELIQGTNIVTANSSTDMHRIQALLSSVNYNYLDRYYLSGSYRKDGSSRFDSSNRWGDFWSLGFSWRVSEESFLRSQQWLDNLTLKVSYGCQGNDDIGTFYAWQRTYRYGYENGYYPGLYVSQLGNKDLKWEKNNNFNAGAEMRMFNQRLSLSFEGYTKKTTDMLLYRTLPQSIGHSGVYENVGSMRNVGFDMTLSYVALQRPNFTWTPTLIVSKYKNKVLSLDKDGGMINMGGQIVKEGETAYAYYLPKFAGVRESDGSQLYWTEDENGNAIETDNASLAKEYIHGSRIPKFYGSFSNQINWKKIDFGFLITYSVGGKILDNNYATLMSSGRMGYNFHKDMSKRWRQNGDKTDIPRLEDGYMVQATDRYLVDASYLGIKNISLGYTLPFKGQGITSMRLSLTGDNLYTLTARKGIDPQYSFVGNQGFGYASVRNISFGVDINF